MRTVVVSRTDAHYPAAPFHPPRLYPEHAALGLTETDPENLAYDMVRRVFERMGLDESRLGTRDWNPIGDLVDPSSRVVIKPNFVQHYSHAGHLEQLVTQPALLRPILDYLLIALGTLDRVRVLDAPEIDCDLAPLLHDLGWAELTRFYEALGQELVFLDIRTERADYQGGGAIVDRISLPGDPRGYVSIDLQSNSELAPIAGDGRFYGADYDRRWTNAHHTKTRNVYRVSRSFLEADLVISVPKLKTHKKAALTCAMKNLVGINGDKNLLPHYTVGSSFRGGCEYSSEPSSFLQHLSRSADRWYRDHVLSKRVGLAGRLYNRFDPVRHRAFQLVDEGGLSKGDWWGNDVVWRMILDLNKILAYASANSHLGHRKIRKQLAIVDAIVAGSGEGPHRANPHRLGCVIGGTDPVAVDSAGALLLGFDPERVPQLSGASRVSTHSVGSRLDEVIFDYDDGVGALAPADFARRFEPAPPPAGWVGHVERADPSKPR